MPADMTAPGLTTPMTQALRQALSKNGLRGAEDWLFLERWEADPMHGPADALRAGQLRRANPELAAAIRAELSQRNK